MKHCFKCKAVYSSLSNRSFHRLPNDSALRTRWIENLGLPQMIEIKNVYICSDHFNKDSFYDFQDEKLTKRLKREALPVIVPDSTCSTIDKLRSDDVNVTSSIKKSHDGLMDTTLFSIQNPSSSSSSSSRITFALTDDHKHSANKEDCISNNSEEMANLNNIKKRKLNVQNEGVRKRMRFTIQNKVHYLSRSDFSSDEAWNTFLLYKRLQDSKVAAARNRNSRRKSRIMSLNGMIKKLKERNESDTANYLKVF